jgi:hypothetical protein
MTDHTDQPAASGAALTARDDLVEVTVPVPAAHLASFYQTVATWFMDDAEDDSGRGRMRVA